jgi:putative NADH-flavin reductase
LLVMLELFRGRMSRDTVEEAKIISNSGLDWTIVRANLLTNGPLTKKYRAGNFDQKAGTRVSRADVADFMISCCTDGKFVRARPLVSE